MERGRRLLILFGAILGLAFAPLVTRAQESPSPSPSPSPETSASPAPEASASPTPASSPSLLTSPSPAQTEAPFYDIGDEIYAIKRAASGFYYFQGNRDGSAKVKQEVRYSRNLWTDSAQIGIRIPVITRFPVAGNPYSGLGNIELGYSYGVVSPTLDHYLEARVAFATEANGVESNDTQLKGFYNLKWKLKGWSIALNNEYDQTIIHPPGSSWTSYYEQKISLPEARIAKKLRLSLFWNARWLFDSGGIVKDALGGTFFGNMGTVAVSLTDSWGLGANGLWKYKFEALASVKF
jgi:hypothetical protein